MHANSMDVMDIDDEILARVRAAKAWDPSAKLEDFQIRATADGYILTNLKAGYSQFILDRSSYLDDFRRLFPDICPCKFVGEASETSKSSGSITAV